MCLFFDTSSFYFSTKPIATKTKQRYEYNSSTDKTDNITNCHNDIIDTSKILYTTTELHQKINY